MQERIIIEAAGVIGSVLLVVHFLPQLWKVFKDGHAEGLSVLMIWLWFWGEVFMLYYTIEYKAWSAVALCGISIAQALVFLKYKYFPKD